MFYQSQFQVFISFLCMQCFFRLIFHVTFETDHNSNKYNLDYLHTLLGHDYNAVFNLEPFDL